MSALADLMARAGLLVPGAQHRRLPEPKDAVIERCRAALEARGIPTEGWWQVQLDLCTVGMMAVFGWQKALGDDDELGWWADRVDAAVHRQRLGRRTQAPHQRRRRSGA